MTTPDAVRVADALADSSRLALLAALLEGEATVSDLAARLGLAQPRASTHLARLRASGLVETVAIGRHRAAPRRSCAPSAEPCGARNRNVNPSI